MAVLGTGILNYYQVGRTICIEVVQASIMFSNICTSTGYPSNAKP